MTDINVIQARLVTGNRAAAGTDGRVYIGAAGREFRIDAAGNDFERGANRTYILGQGSGVRNAGSNDPRNPQLDTEDLDKYPVYLRFEPSGGGPDWNVERVQVTVNPGRDEVNFDNLRLSGAPDVWLGTNHGKAIYLSPQN